LLGRRLRPRAGGLDSPLGLGPGIGRLDQTFAKTARTPISTIAPAFYRKVRPFAIAASLFVAVTFPSAVARPVFKSRRRGRNASTSRTKWVGTRRRTSAIVTTAAPTGISLARVPLARTGRLNLIVSALGSEVLRLDVRDMQKAVAADGKVDECGLNGRFEIDDPALVNVACVALVTGSLHVKLFEDAVFNNCDPAFLRLEHVDQHFFLHAVSFQDLRR
jgi:hypothetical protein